MPLSYRSRLVPAAFGLLAMACDPGTTTPPVDAGLPDTPVDTGPPVPVSTAHCDYEPVPATGHSGGTVTAGTVYAGVAEDPELRALYPEEDLGSAAERLTLFLVQYWGGPTTYSQRRGHPRLRMRHAPFVVDSAQRDRWLRHMRAALDTLALPPAYDRTLWEYLSTAADSLRNTPE